MQPCWVNIYHPPGISRASRIHEEFATLLVRRPSVFKTLRLAFGLPWKGSGSAPGMEPMRKIRGLACRKRSAAAHKHNRKEHLALSSGTHLPPGYLPGDIYYRGKHGTFYFPLTTCILLSAILSAAFYLINRLSR